MSKYKAGVKLNYLTILKIIRLPKNSSKVLCKCDCGNIKEFYLSNIIPRKGESRYTKSCGCKKKELISSQVTTHGLSKTKFYVHWRSMKNRMLPTYINADSYVGIKICDKWQTFDNFYTDMYESWLEHEKRNGGRNTSLDRIDVYGDYCKENCRWATQAEQGLNKKNTSKVIYREKEVALKTLCKELNKNYDRVYHRIHNGFPLERALHSRPWQREISLSTD